MGNRCRSAQKLLTLLLGLMLDWDTFVTRECTWCRCCLVPFHCSNGGVKTGLAVYRLASDRSSFWTAGPPAGSTNDRSDLTLS